MKVLVQSVCVLCQLIAVAQASEVSPTYLFDRNPSSSQSGPFDAAIQLGYYIGNLTLVKKCDLQRKRQYRTWENRIEVGILSYSSRYRLASSVRDAAESEVQNQLNILLKRGKISLKMCRNADAMFRKALASNMEPPNGTLASSDAEMKNEALIENLKGGFSGSVRRGHEMVAFKVDHFMRTDHRNFSAIMNWETSGATNAVSGRVSGNEQLFWKETIKLKGKSPRECEYTLNRRNQTSMAGGWNKCLHGGFVEITLPERLQ